MENFCVILAKERWYLYKIPVAIPTGRGYNDCNLEK